MTTFAPAPIYTLGLDLGQVKDYTALVIVERHGEAEHAVYQARHLERFALGTPYPEIVASVARMLELPPLKGTMPRIAVDETGVGVPVVDLFRQARLRATLHPIHITGGSTVNYDRGVEYVPKRNLVSIVQVALQTEKLKIASVLPDAQNLVRELQDFQMKITEAANDTYGAWRAAEHDDLVLATALALYVGKKPGQAIQVPLPGSSGYREFRW
jgi:hypothetical protein